MDALLCQVRVEHRGRAVPRAPRCVRVAGLLLAVVTIGGLVACHREAVTAPVTAIAVSISPRSGSVGECSVLQLTADIVDQAGRFVVPDSIGWSSSDTTVARISAGGLLLPQKPAPAVTLRALAYLDRNHGSAEAVFSVVSARLLSSSGVLLPCPPR